MDKSDSLTKSHLMKKLLVICPVCRKPIHGRDIDINKIDKNNVHHWPLTFTHCHTYNQVPLHALTVFLDSNFSVRGKQVSNFIKIQK